MKNLIIYVLSVILALLIGFIATSTVLVDGLVDVDIHAKHDKE